MADDHLGLWHQALQQRADRKDGLDTVVDEVHLAAAVELGANRSPDHLLIEPHDVGLDRQPILGRRLDDRHVADPDERHVERPRNGRRRHREDVDLPPELLDLLLVGDAEALFLVHDQQAQIAKLDVLRQQPMGADDDVDFARGQVRQRHLLSILTIEPADHFDADRKAREALAQRFLMLERQNRCGRQDGDLLAVHRGLEGGAHRHFRLAVADVAAEEPIHWGGRLHVGLDIRHGRLLVGCQLVLEGVLELLLPVRVGAEGVAGHGLARGVELEQLLRHVAHGLLDFRLGALPRDAAQLVDRRPGGAGVLLDEVQSLDGHEQFVVARVAELEKLLLAVADPDLAEANEHADAMVHVHDQVADLEVPQVRQKRLRGRPASLGRPALLLEDVGFGVDLQPGIRQAEAARQAAGGDQHGGVPRILRALDGHGEDLVLLQELDGPFGAPWRRRHEQDGRALLAQLLDLCGPFGHASSHLDGWLTPDFHGWPGSTTARDPGCVDAQLQQRRALRETRLDRRPVGEKGGHRLRAPGSGLPAPGFGLHELAERSLDLFDELRGVGLDLVGL